MKKKKKQKGSDLVEKERIKKIFLLIKIYRLHLLLIFTVQFKKKKKKKIFLIKEFFFFEKFKEIKEIKGQKKKKEGGKKVK